MLPAPIEIRGERARRDLYEFVKLMWPVLEPGAPFVDGFHIRMICDALQAVTAGEVRRLIINVPPRHGKSNLVSILWPAWVWVTHPHRRWLFASYAQALAERHSGACRHVIESPDYRQLYGHGFQLAADANQKSRFETNRGGARLATSVGGAATGEGGDIIVIDDPLKIEDASSKLALADVIRSFDLTLSTRLNNRQTGAIVLVCQRLNERDLAGHLLARGGWQHLCLPAEYDQRHPHISPDDPRSVDGQLLWPEMYGAADIAELKEQLGSYGVASQLQQLPAPLTGGIFAKDRWCWYDPAWPPRCEQVIISVDLAYTGNTGSDYSVAQVWGVLGADKFLLHQAREKLSFRGQISMIRRVHELTRERYSSAHSPGIYVEKTANGAALIDQLGKEIPALIPVTPRGDKVTRAMAVSPQVEAGNIHLPGAANASGTGYDPTCTPRWVQGFVEETAGFPAAAYDDQVDAFTQAITCLDQPGPRLRVLG